MIKILNTQQIRELDAYTIKHEPVASIDLMERACRTFTEWFTQQFDVRNKITIVCGTGNNGGDGLGIARLLTDWGYAVKVFVIRGGASESVDFSVNLERLKKLKTEIIELDAAPSAALLSGGDVIIDAIFGSGLSRPPQGIYAAVIDQINQCSATTVAVDIPSGLMADGPSSGSIVQAQFTVTFQVPKLSFFFPSGYAYTGEWIVADIGLNKSFVKEAVTPHYAVTEKAVIKFLRHRHKFDHKGTFGHALLISGSKGKMGAAVLAARAALRSGAGLLTVHLPQCGYSIMQTALPEAMVQVDPHEEIYSSNPAELSPYTVIGLGPGLGQHTDTAEAFQQLLEQYRKPLVIDADGLNILAAQRQLLHLVPAGSILTPHPKEFERIVGPWKNDFERLEKQKRLARELKSVVLVKGAFTSIVAPDGTTYFNSTGNPGMAKGGSGDVLTGILTGLLAQNYTAIESAVLGAYVHGLAGDLVVHEMGMYSVLATDLVEVLPRAFRHLMLQKKTQ